MMFIVNTNIRIEALDKTMKTLNIEISFLDAFKEALYELKGDDLVEMIISLNRYIGRSYKTEEFCDEVRDLFYALAYNNKYFEVSYPFYCLLLFISIEKEEGEDLHKTIMRFSKNPKMEAYKKALLDMSSPYPDEDDKDDISDEDWELFCNILEEMKNG